MTRKNDEALRRLSDGITPGDAGKLLASLRWREDIVITNHEGERVWLRALCDDDGKRLGITDCCPEEYPCSRHGGPSGRPPLW